MTTEHTPGPYRAVPRDGDTIRVDVVTYGLPFAPSFVAGDMLPKDAALLVAAPTLAEEHQMMEVALRQFLGNERYHDQGGSQRVYDNAYASIVAQMWNAIGQIDVRARGIGQNIDVSA